MSFMDDIKISLSLAKNNMLSFLLAVFGMTIMIGIVIAIIIAPLIVAAFLANPDPTAFGIAISQFFSGFSGIISGDPITGLFAGGAIGLLFLNPFAAVGAWFFGALYGMSNEIILSGGTQAESAFGYLRKNMKAYFGAGVILALVMFVPMWLIGLVTTALTGFTSVPVGWEIPIGIITFAYFYIMGGFVMLLLPAATDGVGMVESLKTSFRLTKANIVRVFGAWTIFVIILGLIVGPIAAYAIATGTPGTLDPVMMVLIAWTAIGAIIFVLFILPAVFLTFTRIYLSLTGKLDQPAAEIQ